MKKTILIMILLSILGKSLGMLRDIMVTKYLGFGTNTDALLLAIAIPTLIFSIFQTSIRTTFAPLFAKSYKENNIKAVYDFNLLKNFLLLLIIILCVLLLHNSSLLIKIFSPGLNQSTALITKRYLDLSLWLILTYGFFYIFTGFLQSIKIFTTLEVAGIFNNVVIILFVVNFYDKYGGLAVVYGYLAGSIIQAIYSYIITIIKSTYKPQIFNLKSIKIIPKYLNLSKYIFAGSFVTQISSVSDKFFASFLKPGSITALNYANLIKNLPQTILILTITNVLFSDMAIYHKEDKDKFNKLVNKQLEIILLILLLITTVFLCFSKEIITILFLRGSFTNIGVQMTSTALVCYSIGIVFWGIKEVFSKVCYAAEYTKIPLIISISSMIINIILNYLFALIWGYAGIALSTSISFAINCILIIVLVIRQKLVVIEFKTVKRAFLILNYSIFIFIIFLFLKRFILNYIGFLLLRVLSGVIIIFGSYFAIGYFMGYKTIIKR